MRKIWNNKVLSVAAFILSVCSCLFVIVRVKPITIDWFGVLVGILSLLVTVLIGWNIYTFIDIKNTEKRLDKFREEFEGKISASCAGVRFDIRTEMLNTVPLLIKIMKHDSDRPLVEPLSSCFKTFHAAENESMAKMIAREYILGTLMLCQEELDNSQMQRLLQELNNELSIEEVEDFLREFLTYSDEEKNQRYPGLQNVLFELMKAHT